jgi:hypothetical protein
MNHLKLLIKTGSMFPALQKGDTAYCLAVENFKVGDVICFENENKNIVHRLVFNFPPPFHNWFLEKGDFSGIPSLISRDNIIGPIVFPFISRTISISEQILNFLKWIYFILKFETGLGNTLGKNATV